MLAILLAEEVAEVTLQTQHKISALFWESDLFTKIILLTTLFFSIASWAVIGMKQRQLKRAKKSSEKFLSVFWRTQTIDQLLQKGHFIKSPVTQIFKSAITALKEHSDKKEKERISYQIRKATEDEEEALESYTSFLATTATAAPLLGLLGTVWGILNAFWALKYAGGATSLEVFGPHIGEALSTTALGLITALPAIIFYNIFASRIKLINRDMVQFSDDLLNRIDDEYLNS